MSDRTQIIAATEEQEDLAAGSNMKEQMYAAATEAAQFLRAIGSEQRLMILCVLMEGRKTVTEICLATGSRQSLVSQHLTRLRLDGLVEVERQGHFAYYTMNDPLVRDIVSALHRRFCAQGNITSA